MVYNLHYKVLWFLKSWSNKLVVKNKQDWKVNVGNCFILRQNFCMLALRIRYHQYWAKVWSKKKNCIHIHQGITINVARSFQILSCYMSPTTHSLVQTQKGYPKTWVLFFKSDPSTLHCVIWWSIDPWRGPIDKRSSSHTRLSDQKKKCHSPFVDL